MIRLLIAEDHQIVRAGIIEILKNEPDITVIAEAENGRQVVELAAGLLPDIILMDISMPEMNGIEATRRIVSGSHESRVLILSMHSDKRYVEQAMLAGAKGIILKGCSTAELLKGIRAIVAGEHYFSPQIVDYIVADYKKLLPDKPCVEQFELTSREREVVQLIAEGKSTKEIAYSLNVSVKTIESHRQQLMKKLNIYNVAELTKYAIREGIISID